MALTTTKSLNKDVVERISHAHDNDIATDVHTDIASVAIPAAPRPAKRDVLPAQGTLEDLNPSTKETNPSKDDAHDPIFTK